MNYIKINRKVSAGVYQNFYMPSEVEKIIVTNGSSGATRTTSVAITTIPGPVHTLTLTEGIVAADDQKVLDYFWGQILEANAKGTDFAGIASTFGSDFEQGVVGGAAILYLTISGGSAPIAITIDNDVVT
jgi:hypothetical protein